MRSKKTNKERGATLVEVSIAMVILSVCVVAGFASFTLSQRILSNAVVDTQMTQIAQNECERQLSLPYNLLGNITAQPVSMGTADYLVTTVVTELPSAASNPRWKHVLVRVSPASTPANQNDDVTMVVVKSP